MNFVKKFVKKLEQIFVNLSETKFVILLCALIVGFSLSYIQDGHDWGDDYSCYIAQAKSILDNTMTQQVEANTYIVTHSHTMLGPGAYPWGYPLMLAGIIYFCGLNYVAMKCLNLLFFVVGVIFLYRMLGKRVECFYARVGALMLGMSPIYVSMTNCILSDIPFFFFSVLSVASINKMYKAKEKQILWAIATGVTCFAAYFVRTNGIVSILTLLFTDLVLVVASCIPILRKKVSLLGFQKQKFGNHMLAYSIFFVLAFMTKLVFPSADEGYDFYLKKLSWQSIWSNIVNYTNSFQEFFWLGKVISTVLIICASFLIIYGIFRNFYKEFPMIVYIGGMTVLILLFPAFQGIRYFFSVIPFTIILGAEGLQEICKKKQCIMIRDVILFAVLVLMVLRMSGHVAKKVVNPLAVNGNAANSEAAMDMYSYIIENTNEEDIFAFFKPRALWLNTGRKGYSIESENVDTITDVDYVLIPHGGTEYDLKSAVLEIENAELVYENAEFELYEIDHY